MVFPILCKSTSCLPFILCKRSSLTTYSISKKQPNDALNEPASLSAIFITTPLSSHQPFFTKPVLSSVDLYNTTKYAEPYQLESDTQNSKFWYFEQPVHS